MAKAIAARGVRDTWTMYDDWRTVPDPMPLAARFLRGRPGGCHAPGPDRLKCSRPAGHTRRHLAVDMNHGEFSPIRDVVPGVIVGVWP